MDWSSFYPAFVTTPEEVQADPQSEIDIEFGRVRQLKKDVEVADIGCGFGGLLVALAPVLPDTLLLGMVSLKLCIQALTMARRHGNTDASHRVCPRANQSSPSPKSRHRPVPEHWVFKSQRYEVPAKLLQEAATIEDLLLLPRSTFQGSKT
jgi:hypothetical protein